MTTDDILDALPDRNVLIAGGVASLAALVLLAVALRALRKVKLARIVTTLATGLGLGWSAQGMWDTAVHHYKMSETVAWVIFLVFESLLMAKMLKAHEYRADFARRARPVRFVWITASVMALVVALGEGWAQAPARLAIPLLVAYGWYTDLIADDDPGERPRSTLRWTPRRLALLVGAIEAGERDAETIDRDRLRNRITRLAFRLEHGTDTLNDLLRRRVRLAKLKTLADDADVAEVRARLARSKLDLMTTPEPAPEPAETHPVLPPQPKPKEVISAAKPAQAAEPDRRVQGVHSRMGRTLRGAELEADAITVHRRSLSPDRPRGLTAAELATLYSPPLGMRKAEDYAAKARKQVNGHVPEGITLG